jgi:hypothetical protein
MNYEPNLPEGLNSTSATGTLIGCYMFLTGDKPDEETWVMEKVNLYYLFLEDRNPHQQKQVDETVDCLKEFFIHIWKQS